MRLYLYEEYVIKAPKHDRLITGSNMFRFPPTYIYRSGHYLGEL